MTAMNSFQTCGTGEVGVITPCQPRRAFARNFLGHSIRFRPMRTLRAQPRSRREYGSLMAPSSVLGALSSVYCRLKQSENRDEGRSRRTSGKILGPRVNDLFGPSLAQTIAVQLMSLACLLAACFASSTSSSSPTPLIPSNEGLHCPCFRRPRRLWCPRPGWASDD